MASIPGGEAIAKILKNEGVEKVFGIIDGTYFGFYSSLRKYGIELITPRHETSAVHMAGAYARLTGKLGVCMASNGPGVANALPGVAVENVEGNRVLLITSSRRNPIIYPDRGGTYQCFDHTAVIRPMAKYSEAVRTPERIPEIMHQALRKAFQGRPGVVHVDVPENYMNEKFRFEKEDFLVPEKYRLCTPLKASPEHVQQAADMLVKAEFPVIHAGSGVIHALAFDELESVSNLLYAPVTSSWGARGALCEKNPLSVPMIYIELNDEIHKAADLILTLGSRIGETDRWGKMPHWGNPSEQKMIQVDLDPDFLGRNKPVDLAVMADVKSFLQDLQTEIKKMKKNINVDKRKSLFSVFLHEKAKVREKLDKNLKDQASPMNTAHVASLCKQVFADDAIAVFDGGNTAVWSQFYYTCTSPGSGISTPKMGMLGAGVSQALGAAVAMPQKQVYCIIGDGAMGFHPQEIETAIRNGLKVVYIVVCDKQWGMVKMNQQFALRPIKTLIKKSLDEEETINADFSEIKFDELAQSMGAYGERAASPKDLKKVLQQAIGKDKCVVIHVDVDPVKHMWAPSLMYFKKMHEEPKGK